MHKRHPVLFGLLLLSLIGVLFFFLVYGMSSVQGEKTAFISKDRIGVVPVKGVIIDPKPVNDVLEKFGKDDGIKAVVLRIDTPGGGVGPSQEIYEKATVHQSSPARQYLNNKENLGSSLGKALADIKIDA